MMHAIVFDRYGPPEVLNYETLPIPVAGPGDIVVKNHAALLASTDSTARRGAPAIARLYFGLRKPKFRILGSEFAGIVHEIGSGVTHFAVGDRVLGIIDTFGAHAEYVCLPEIAGVVQSPAELEHAEAVTLTEGPLTSLPFLRDTAGLKPGQHILINGASGSVGTAAVQLAKHFGAIVTGVTSTANLELVRELGADHVIDYTTQDFTRMPPTFDVIFDAVGKSSFLKSKRALNPGGLYMTTVPSLAIGPQMLWTKLFGGKRAAISLTGLRPAEKKYADLIVITELSDAGQFKPVVDRRYPLADAAEAHRYVDTGRKRGNVVLTM